MWIRTIVRISKLGAGTGKYKGGRRRPGTDPVPVPPASVRRCPTPSALILTPPKRPPYRRMPHAQSLAAADAALIAAWQGGDEQAAAELVRRHARALARFLGAAGAPDADLDDLVQETFIRAFRAVGRFRGQCQFRTWLLT